MRKIPSIKSTACTNNAPVNLIKSFAVVFALTQLAAASAQTAVERMQQQNYDCFSGMKFASVNCNSLNLSSANKPVQLRKIYAIAKLNCDVIFLSDTRLSKKSTSGCIADLRNNFTTNPYAQYTFITTHL